MRYKVFVSNGYEGSTFYCEEKGSANELFNMAVASNFYAYVSLSETIDKDFIKREWEAEDNNNDRT
jgi:hypothetical protein